MRKLSILLLTLTLFMSGCSAGKPKYVSDIYPSELLTADNISPYLDYTPEMNEEQRSRRMSVVRYQSNPIGKGDPVIVKVYQKNGLQTAEQVKEFYDECKTMRSDAFSVDIDAEDSFIAYPSLHYYIDGYHVEITAGSGSDDLQKTLLTNLAKVSIENFTKLTGVSASDLLTADADKTDNADSKTE